MCTIRAQRYAAFMCNDKRVLARAYNGWVQLVDERSTTFVSRTRRPAAHSLTLSPLLP